VHGALDRLSFEPFLHKSTRVSQSRFVRSTGISEESSSFFLLENLRLRLGNRASCGPHPSHTPFVRASVRLPYRRGCRETGLVAARRKYRGFRVFEAPFLRAMHTHSLFFAVCSSMSSLHSRCYPRTRLTITEDKFGKLG
jgi:hypothetical protein